MVNLLRSLRFCMLLDLFFIKAISIFWCIELFFYSDESLSPCRWKTAPQHEAAASTLYFWDGTPQVMSRADILQTWCLELRFIRPENLVSHESEGPLGAFSKCVSMRLNWSEDWVWPHCHKAQIGGVLQWCLSFCRFLPSAYVYDHGAQLEWPSASWSPH